MTMDAWIFRATILQTLVASVCGNVLLFPMYTPSRRLFYDTINTHLTLAEHDVTFLIYQDDFNNCSLSDVPSEETIFVKTLKQRTLDEWEERALANWNYETTTIPSSYLTHLARRCEFVLGDKNLMLHLKDKKLDVVVMDLFGNDICGLALARMLGVPAIGVTTSLLTEPLSYFTGNPFVPSYLPTTTTLSDTNDLVASWTTRALNLISYLSTMAFWKWNYFGPYQDVACKYLPECPSVDELYSHLQLVFVNSDAIVEVPRPLMPNVVPIGGLAAQVPRLLPKELEATARSYRSGIVLVSLETSVPTEKLPGHILQTLVESLSKLPHATFWKAKNGTVRHTAANIFLDDNFCVQDILGHARTRVIIAFCSTDTVFSAIFHGVPLVCLPLLEEHLTMARIVEQRGLGRKLTLDQFNSDTFSREIQSILTNKSYQENVRAYSKRLRDQPSTPSDRLIYWIEYIVRHNGAQHLTPTTSKLSIVQYFLLDVTLLPVLLFLVVVIVWLGVVRTLRRNWTKTTRTKRD